MVPINAWKELRPDDDPDESQQAKHGSEQYALDEFPPHDTPPVCQGEFTDRHRLDDEGGGLRTGIASAGNDQGYK